MLQTMGTRHSDAYPGWAGEGPQMDRRHDWRSVESKASSARSAALDPLYGTSFAASPSSCSTFTCVLKLSFNGAGQASSIHQESFYSFRLNGWPTGRRQNEAAALEHDINGYVVMSRCQKRMEFSWVVRCELDAPSFVLFCVNSHTACSRRRSVKGSSMNPPWAGLDSMWVLTMALFGSRLRGQECKRETASIA